MKNHKEQITAAINETFDTISDSLINYMPKVLAAIAVLSIGIVIAKITSNIIKRLFNSTESLLFRHLKKSDDAKIQPSQWIDVFCDIVKWSLILFFITTSANILSWNSLSKLTEIVLSYIPNLVFGIFIIISGLFLSNLARTTFIKTTKSIDAGNSRLISSLIYYITLVAAIFVGVEQIGINIHFITNIIIIVIGTLLLGLAFSFTVGAKSLVANFIGSQFARKNCNSGNYIRINNIEGELIDISKTSIILHNKNKKILVPAKLFNDEITEISITNNEQS